MTPFLTERTPADVAGAKRLLHTLRRTVERGPWERDTQRPWESTNSAWGHLRRLAPHGDPARMTASAILSVAQPDYGTVETRARALSIVQHALLIAHELETK